MAPHPSGATLGRCYTRNWTLYLRIFFRLLLYRNVFGGQSWFCLWYFRTVSQRKFLKTKLPHASKLFINCFVILRLDESLILNSGLYPGTIQKLRSVQAIRNSSFHQYHINSVICEMHVLPSSGIQGVGTNYLSSKGFRSWNSTSQHVIQCCNCEQKQATQNSFLRNLGISQKHIVLPELLIWKALSLVTLLTLQIHFTTFTDEQL